MKKREMKQVLPLHLQFFGSKEEEINDKDDPQGEVTDDNDGDDGVDDGDDDSTGGTTEKTFTQKEVTAMMTREKKEGRKALLKQLGFKTEADAKNAVALYAALVDSQKTEEDKMKEQNSTLADEKKTAEERAEAAENKLACVVAGVRKDALDDVLAIAKLKVTDDKSLDKVLAEMKEESRYASFFQTDENGNVDDGTGNSTGHSKGKGKAQKGSYGASLAKKMQGQKQENKKTYF